MSEEAATDTATDTATGDWRSTLPEGFGEASFIKGADSPEAALTAINNAASHMGNSIRIPGEDASEDARNDFYGKILEKAPNLMPKPSEDNMDAFYASIGRPGKPDEYNFEAPEGREIPDDFAAFAEAAHKNGLTQDQFRGVLGEILGSAWEGSDAVEAAQAEEMKGLKTEWGQAFDQNIDQVKNFLRLTEAPEGIMDLVENGAMSPTEIQWIHSIATKTASSTELAKQTTTTVPNMLTPGEAQEKISEMLNNSEHPYWNNSDIGHKRAINRMVELQRMANPGS